MEAGNRLMKQVLWDSMQELMAGYKSREDTCLQELSGILQQLVDLTVRRQKEGTKGKVCYIGICYCRSSIFTDIHEMNLDGEECSMYWEPGFIFNFYQRDMQYFRTHIRKVIPRVRTWEIQQYGEGYWMNYVYILSEFLRQKLPEAMGRISMEGLLKDEKLRVFFGEYMGRGAVLYEEASDEIFSDQQ